MKALIIEDENPAKDRLVQLLRKIDHSITVVGSCTSIRESTEWLQRNDSPDLIFLDIQLSDGLSLELFKRTEIKIPVIFTTAYDDYVLEAFEHYAIDYLLKPIKEIRLNAAINKYKTLNKHFSKNYSLLVEQFFETKKSYKSRFTVKSGLDFITIPVEEISYFYTEHKVTFLQSYHESKYIIDKSLSDLESVLNPKMFYRLNRKLIVNKEFISKFKPFSNSKLLVELIPPFREPVTVSQEKSSDFKKWIED